jgi:hypothetical protein
LVRRDGAQYQGAIVEWDQHWQSENTQENSVQGEFMKKATLFVIVIAIVLAIPSSSFAATSVASLKGVYNFQISGITNQSGYYTGNTWHPVNGQCPQSESCFVQAFEQLAYGTISFDGKGHATFTSSPMSTAVVAVDP